MDEQKRCPLAYIKSDNMFDVTFEFFDEAGESVWNGNYERYSDNQQHGITKLSRQRNNCK